MNIKVYEGVLLDVIELSARDVITTSDVGPWDTTVGIQSTEIPDITNDGGMTGGAK